MLVCPTLHVHIQGILIIVSPFFFFSFSILLHLPSTVGDSCMNSIYFAGFLLILDNPRCFLLWLEQHSYQMCVASTHSSKRLYINAIKCILRNLGIPCSSVSKVSACSVGDPGSIPGLGRSLREENGYPIQYPCRGVGDSEEVHICSLCQISVFSDSTEHCWACWR